MTAEQMLTAALNGALCRKVVNGPLLRKKLIAEGKIKPGGRWVYVPSPNGNHREAKLVWEP